MEVQVIEFKSQNECNQWLQAMSDKITTVNVSTTKRWSLWSGFLGDNKTYTVTYEDDVQAALHPAPSVCPKCRSCEVFERSEPGQWFCRACNHIWHTAG